MSTNSQKLVADSSNKNSTVKIELRKALDGYKLADELLWEERRKRMNSMTIDESWAIYSDLVASWRMPPQTEGLQRLQDWRLENKLLVRATFYDLAVARGHL